MRAEKPLSEGLVEPRCFWCNDPVEVGSRGRIKAHCGKPECAAAIKRGLHAAYRQTGWPKVTGEEWTGDFSPHNIEVEEYGKVGLPPLNRSRKGEWP